MSAAARAWSRLGLPRPELRAWALYDWADSAYVTTIISVLFPIYFGRVAAEGLSPEVATARFALGSSVALGVVAVLSPVLGALSDRAGILKKLLGFFLGLGVVSSAALGLVGHGQWVLGLVLFGVGNVGMAGSLVFYDTLLRHIARDDELDRASTAGYALGYLGGGLLLSVHLLWVAKPGWFGLPSTDAAFRLAFVSVAVWWLGFSLPLFRRIPEPRPSALTGVPPEVSFRAVLAQLRETFGELRKYRQALLLILAYLLYSDGIGTIIRMSTLYATGMGMGPGALVAAILFSQAVGVPATLLFGKVATRVGPKRALMVTLGVYACVSFLAYFMRTAAHFFVLATVVGLVQGGSQALSRSLFTRLVPRHKATQFFGFFSVFEKFSALFGPVVVAAMVGLTGSSRAAILSMLFFFVAGAVVLSRVDVEAGIRAARDAEARAAPH